MIDKSEDKTHSPDGIDDGKRNVKKESTEKAGTRKGKSKPTEKEGRESDEKAKETEVADKRLSPDDTKARMDTVEDSDDRIDEDEASIQEKVADGEKNVKNEDTEGARIKKRKPKSKKESIKGQEDCKQCGKLNTNPGQLNRHLKTHTGEQSYKCQFCEKSFSINTNLQRHVRSILTKERPYDCQYCGESSQTSGNLRRHIKRNHKDRKDKSSFQVVRPVIESKTLGAVSRAEKIQNLEDDKEETTIKKQSSLKDIRRTLESEVPEQTRVRGEKKCEYCGKRFPNNGNVRRHIRTVHNGERNYQCSQCERKFQQKSSLERHTGSHERGFSWKAGEGSYTCDLCDKAFSNKSNLNKHKNKHTKTTRGSEHKASTIYHPSKPDLLSCKRCDFKSDQEINIISHFKKVHKPGQEPERKKETERIEREREMQREEERQKQLIISRERKRIMENLKGEHKNDDDKDNEEAEFVRVLKGKPWCEKCEREVDSFESLLNHLRRHYRGTTSHALQALLSYCHHSPQATPSS